MTGLLEKATSEKRLAGSEGIKNEEMQGKHVSGRGKSHGKGMGTTDTVLGVGA